MLSSGCILDGKYEVIKTLGQGGMSTVYLCRNTRLENLWAIKEVRKELKDQINFLAEPNILKNLSHPGVPRVVDIFYEEDNLYMVEDYIEGETLEDYIKNNDNLDSKDINKIIFNLCDIIEYLHSFNPPIIYRDLKPSNIMVTTTGKVVLIDFGISRVYKQNGDKDTVYMGSKGYAAPEQYGREQTCKQTDIYGLGAVIYFMVTKKAPTSLLGPLKDESYINECSRKLKHIVQRCMQLDIKDRYNSIEELQRDLDLFPNREDYTKREDSTKGLERNNKQPFDKTLLMNDNGSTNIYGAGFRNELNNKLNNKLNNIPEIPETKFINNEVVENKDSFEFAGKDTLNKSRNRLKDILFNNAIPRIKMLAKIGKNKMKSMNKFRVKSSSLFKKKTLEDKPSKKKLKRRVAAISIAAVILAATAYLVTDHGNKVQIIANSNETGVNNKNKDTTPANANIQTNENKGNSQQPATKDTIIEGAINKNSPILLSNNTDNKDDNKPKGNGKAKGKNKHNDGEGSQGEDTTSVNDIAYQLNPIALSGKFNNKFTMRLEYIEFRGSDAVAYCSIENNTSSSIQVKYDGSTYLVNDKGEYAQVNSSLSTDLSNVPAGAKIQNVKIYFNNFNTNTSRIILKSNASVIGSNNSNGELNLIVNIK